jgi:hypothetical protein
MNTEIFNKFPALFRSTQSNKGYWGSGEFFSGKLRSGRTIPASADENFKLVWEKLEPILNNRQPITIWQFLIVSSIMINETGGTFVPVSELGGLKYMFGTNGGIKKSYNTYAANKTAYALFNDPFFTDAHKELPYYDYIMKDGKKLTKWEKTVYPTGFPDKEEEKAGIIAEADFFKFRGRGLIQTTFRDNYIPLIELTLKYQGVNTIINTYKNKWTTQYEADTQKIASASRNEDWDQLFMHTDLEYAAMGVKAFFDKRPGSLNFKTENDYHLKGKGAGSLYYVGLKVGGTDNYGQVLRARALQIYAEMKKEGLANDTTTL